MDFIPRLHSRQSSLLKKVFVSFSVFFYAFSMLTEISEVKYIRYTRSHNSGNIHGENSHIWAVEQEKSFLEN